MTKDPQMTRRAMLLCVLFTAALAALNYFGIIESWTKYIVYASFGLTTSGLAMSLLGFGSPKPFRTTTKTRDGGMYKDLYLALIANSNTGEAKTYFTSNDPLSTRLRVSPPDKRETVRLLACIENYLAGVVDYEKIITTALGVLLYETGITAEQEAAIRKAVPMLKFERKQG